MVNTLYAGQRVKWLYEPLGQPPQARNATVEAVAAERVTIRIRGRDGDYYRRVEADTIWVVNAERKAAKDGQHTDWKNCSSVY